MKWCLNYCFCTVSSHVEMASYAGFEKTFLAIQQGIPSCWVLVEPCAFCKAEVQRKRKSGSLVLGSAFTQTSQTLGSIFPSNTTLDNIPYHHQCISFIYSTQKPIGGWNEVLLSMECLEIGAEEEHKCWCSRAGKVSLCSCLLYRESCLTGLRNTLMNQATVWSASALQKHSTLIIDTPPVRIHRTGLMFVANVKHSLAFWDKISRIFQLSLAYS